MLKLCIRCIITDIYITCFSPTSPHKCTSISLWITNITSSAFSRPLHQRLFVSLCWLLTWHDNNQCPTQKPFLLTCHHMFAQTNLPSTCLASHSHTRACWQGMCSYLFFLSGASISLVLSLFALFNSAQESCYTPPAFVLVLLLKQR